MVKRLVIFLIFLIPFIANADENDIRFFHHVNVMTGQLAQNDGKVDYDPCGRVQKIEAPLGEQNAIIPLARFSYLPNLTEVRDIDNLLIRYYFTDDRILKIEFFDEHNLLSHYQLFEWDESQKHPRLFRRTLFDSKNSPVFIKFFTYDDAENIIDESYGDFAKSIPANLILDDPDEWDSYETCCDHPIPMTIKFPIHCLIDASDEPSVIHCKGTIQEEAVDWVVSCGFLKKLQFTKEELEAGTINLIDHLSELTPRKERIFGLISYQNGIRTSFPHFMEECLSIVQKIPEGTLLIALHNKTSGLVWDLLRVLQEMSTKETTNIQETRQFLGRISEEIDTINPSLLWGHIVHSEGGAIAKRAIEKMTLEDRDLLKKHLYLFTLGSVLPIPENYACYAMNIYSRQDYYWITSHLLGIGGYHLLLHHFGKHCNIQFIPSSSKWYEKDLFLFDHAFLGGTYGIALDDQIKQWRERFSLYDGQNH